MARGIVRLAPAMIGLSVLEYSPNKTKKSVVGSGHANKTKVEVTVCHLLPGCDPADADAADALAVAICHAYYASIGGHIPALRAALG